ncbi:MAG: hypothetical protein L3J07_03815 [Candidatus Magasanikbacteria bacterium]|nr:hypothetical protein [Candidatus Magasanikbacteria bacterium]
MTKLSLGYKIVKKICKALHKKTFVQSDLTYKIAKYCDFSTLERLIFEINRLAKEEDEPAIELNDDNRDIFQIDPVIYYEVFPEEKTKDKKGG